MSGLTRRNLALAALASALLGGLAAPAAGSPRPRGERLRVVASIPDLADVARRIGGDRVEVTSICRGRENLHTVSPRPSHLIALSKADMLLVLGLWAESAWLPSIVRRARNARIDQGAPGFVDCAEGWEAIQVPASMSRIGGDLHPGGNPHFNLDPRGGRQIADRVLAGLVAVDPDGREGYERAHASYVEELDAAMERWAEIAADWSGRRVVIYHQEFNYLLRWYEVEIVAALEPKPGIPPTPGHLAQVIATVRERGAAAIATGGWSNNRYVEEVSRETGVPAVELPTMVAGVEGADSWIEMMDVVHARLDELLGSNE